MFSKSTLPIEVTGLDHRFGAQHVLRGLDWQVRPGERVGLFGRNGCGKSTLLRGLVGLFEFDRGQARLFCSSCTQLPDEVKARLSYVPQHQENFLDLTARELLLLVAGAYANFDLKLAQRLLREWEVPTDRLQLLLSAGQRQKIALIRALATRPELLLLDEPSALDTVARGQFVEEILDYAAKQEISVVISTHLLTDVENLLTRVVLLAEGVIKHDYLTSAVLQMEYRVYPAKPIDDVAMQACKKSLISMRCDSAGRWHISAPIADFTAIDALLGAPERRVHGLSALVHEWHR